MVWLDGVREGGGGEDREAGWVKGRTVSRESAQEGLGAGRGNRRDV